MRSGLLTYLVMLAAVLGGLAGPGAGRALGQTIVGGVIDQDTTWTLAESPYLAAETVELIGGAVLTIEPGVEVAFERDQGLDTRRGVLIADGLDGDPIVFRSVDGEVGAWPGITTSFDVPAVTTPEGGYVSGPIFRNVFITEADAGVVGSDEPAYFENVNIERCRVAGFSFGLQRESTMWFKGVIVREAGGGLVIGRASRVMLLDCVFEDNPFGGVQIRGGGGEVLRCVFRRNGPSASLVGGGPISTAVGRYASVRSSRIWAWESPAWVAGGCVWIRCIPSSRTAISSPTPAPTPGAAPRCVPRI